MNSNIYRVNFYKFVADNKICTGKVLKVNLNKNFDILLQTEGRFWKNQFIEEMYEYNGRSCTFVTITDYNLSFIFSDLDFSWPYFAFLPSKIIKKII